MSRLEPWRKVYEQTWKDGFTAAMELFSIIDEEFIARITNEEWVRHFKDRRHGDDSPSEGAVLTDGRHKSCQTESMLRSTF